MGIKYSRVVIERKVVEETFELPTRWGMFTDAGNKALTDLARPLYEKVEAGKAEPGDFYDYFYNYRVYLRNAPEGQREASDTAVREAVWCFAETLGLASDCSDYYLDDLWTKTDDAEFFAWKDLGGSKKRG